MRLRTLRPGAFSPLFLSLMTIRYQEKQCQPMVGGRVNYTLDGDGDKKKIRKVYKGWTRYQTFISLIYFRLLSLRAFAFLLHLSIECDANFTVQNAKPPPIKDARKFCAAQHRRRFQLHLLVIIFCMI